MSNKYFISGGTLDDGSKKDLFISDGKISGFENPANSGAQIIDATGKIILPGLVDLHTHLREPGKEDSETVLSASRAGAKGGFTALSAMPAGINTYAKDSLRLYFLKLRNLIVTF